MPIKKYLASFFMINFFNYLQEFLFDIGRTIDILAQPEKESSVQKFKNLFVTLIN